jgi:ubiquinone/menaquinone biosynthesis C-methylase UbiE
MESAKLNEYVTPGHALAYLTNAGQIPHRTEGEDVVLELLPDQVQRTLDLGTGDGRLLALVKQVKSQAQGVALDFSPTMLAAARQRFAGDQTVALLEHNLNDPLPDLGGFDVVLSSFAIHHLDDPRKFRLYEEIFTILEPGVCFVTWNTSHRRRRRCMKRSIAPWAAAWPKKIHPISVRALKSNSTGCAKLALAT